MNYEIDSRAIDALRFWDQSCLEDVRLSCKELFSTEAFCEHMEKVSDRDGATILEVGSNTGCLVDYLLQNTNYNYDRICLFEPIPLYSRWAKFKYAKLLSKPFVEVFECALSDGSSMFSDIYFCEDFNKGLLCEGLEEPKSFDKLNLGFNFMSPELKASSLESKKKLINLSVPSLALDKINMAFERINLIKIDVLGWESHVLKGMKDVLSIFKPYLLIKVLNGVNNIKKNQLAQTLNEAGYFTDPETWPEHTFNLNLQCENQRKNVDL